MKATGTESATHSYVTLGIQQDVFAVNVTLVREILDCQPIARLPHAPPYLLGIIDVRGLTVPVIDLRRKLGFAATDEISQTRRILVLEFPANGRQVVLGLLCDRVFDVAELATVALEAAPDVGVAWKSEYIRAIGRWRNGFVIIFDLERLFTSDEFAYLDGLT
ncbi:MAG: purine-binding chemotaxis protein CheW [Magnetococcales bacterium]|nr:purine-binding chemotaxis protein CheW [Magnetococcales bacterium]